MPISEVKVLVVPPEKPELLLSAGPPAGWGEGGSGSPGATPPCSRFLLLRRAATTSSGEGDDAIAVLLVESVGVELLLPLLLGGAELHCGRSPPRRGSWKLDQERLQPSACRIQFKKLNAENCYGW